MKKWLVLFNDTRQVCDTPQAVIDMMILNPSALYRIVPIAETGSTVVWLGYDQHTEELVDAGRYDVPAASQCRR